MFPSPPSLPLRRPLNSGGGALLAPANVLRVRPASPVGARTDPSVYWFALSLSLSAAAAATAACSLICSLLPEEEGRGKAFLLRY